MSNDPIAESNERQSKFYAENPDAFIPYRGQDEGDHPCDAEDDGCCSICGTDAAKRAADELEPNNEDRTKDCAWCGGYRFVTFSNRRGEKFCCKSCRDASNRALKRLIEQTSSDAARRAQS